MPTAPTPAPARAGGLSTDGSKKVDSTSVRCPICDAAPGQPCEDAVGGWIVRAETPHVYRIQVAAEATRSSTVEDLVAKGWVAK